MGPDRVIDKKSGWLVGVKWKEYINKSLFIIKLNKTSFIIIALSLIKKFIFEFIIVSNEEDVINNIRIRVATKKWMNTFVKAKTSLNRCFTNRGFLEFSPWGMQEVFWHFNCFI